MLKTTMRCSEISSVSGWLPMIAPCLDLNRISKDGIPIFIVALSGNNFNLFAGTLKSILCLASLPDEDSQSRRKCC